MNPPLRPRLTILGLLLSWILWGLLRSFQLGLLLLLGWLVWLGVSGEWRNEVAYWRLAAALEAQADGDLSAAMAAADDALSWDDGDPRLWLARARLRALAAPPGDQLQEALADCRRATELSGHDPLAAWETHSEVLKQAGRFRDSIKLDERVAQRRREQLLEHAKRLGGKVKKEPYYYNRAYASALNSLAYSRALADVELDAAIRGIQDALATSGPNAAMLDTRGYIRWRRGELPQAQKDLHEAVGLAEAQLLEAERRMERARLHQTDLRGALATIESLRRHVAVIRYHRALSLDDDDPVQAMEDRERVRALGFKPNESLY